jgi:hypothetical protein
LHNKYEKRYQIINSERGVGRTFYLMPYQHISKPNLISQPIGIQLLSSLVCKYAGQAFNKMLILPPFS